MKRYVGIHWPGNRYEHWMEPDSDRAVCGLLLMPGASHVHFSEGPEEGPMCPKCATRMDEISAEMRAIATNK